MTASVRDLRLNRSHDGIDAIVAELARQFARLDPSIAEQRGEKLSALAFDRLLANDMLTDAAAVISHLAQTFPSSTYFKNMAVTFATLPPPCEDARFAAFRDDPLADVQVVRRAGASTMLLGFAATGQKCRCR